MCRMRSWYGLARRVRLWCACVLSPSCTIGIHYDGCLTPAPWPFTITWACFLSMPNNRPMMPAHGARSCPKASQGLKPDMGWMCERTTPRRSRLARGGLAKSIGYNMNMAWLLVSTAKQMAAHYWPLVLGHRCHAHMHFNYYTTMVSIFIICCLLWSKLCLCTMNYCLGFVFCPPSSLLSSTPSS